MNHNDYYVIACNDLLYLQVTLNTSFYNQITVNAQQIAEKMLKSLAERVCVNIDKLMQTHNLRAIYMEIHKVLPSFCLDKGSLSMLKDFYFDAKYPGDNYVDVDGNTCQECLHIMYDTVEAVNQERLKLSLPVKKFDRKLLSDPSAVPQELFSQLPSDESES